MNAIPINRFNRYLNELKVHGKKLEKLSKEQKVVFANEYAQEQCEPDEEDLIKNYRNIRGE